MELVLPAAVVVGDEGAELVGVIEVDGVLVDRATDEAIDLAGLVVVVGLDVAA